MWRMVMYRRPAVRAGVGGAAGVLCGEGHLVTVRLKGNIVKGCGISLSNHSHISFFFIRFGWYLYFL